MTGRAVKCTARLLLAVPDPDKVFARALKLGAREITPVHDEHGWRFGRVVDPLGNRAGVVGAIRGEQSAGLSPRSFLWSLGRLYGWPRFFRP